MIISKENPWEKKTYVTSALLSVGEAAQYLRVGRKKIYELIEWGKIKAVKLEQAKFKELLSAPESCPDR